jgi:hypothetical protein
MTTSKFCDLPEELIVRILKELDFRDLLSCAPVILYHFLPSDPLRLSLEPVNRLAASCIVQFKILSHCNIRSSSLAPGLRTLAPCQALALLRNSKRSKPVRKAGLTCASEKDTNSPNPEARSGNFWEAYWVTD